MTLKELLDGVLVELKAAGLEEAGASLSLAFSASREGDGTVTCEFLQTGTIARPKAEELHRLTVTIPEGHPEAHSLALPGDGEKTPSRGTESPGKGMDCGDLDTPSIFRIRLAQDVR